MKTGCLEPTEGSTHAVPKEAASPAPEWAVLEQIPVLAGATIEAITSTTSHLYQGVAKAAGNARRSLLAASNV